VLITIRSASQGGRFAAADADRLAVFRTALTVASWADVEDDAGIIDDVAALVRARPAGQLVVSHHDVLGAFCGDVQDAWRRAADLSSRRHIVWLDRPVARVLSVMPPMYDDLWTAAKGMYKAEPAVADDGEVVILAPHVREVSLMHGPLIEAIGYHCRDYFLAQWERFKDYPGGILAHSTHVKGLGTFDAATGVERPRIRVTLATGISSERTRHVNLGYQDPSGIDPETWRAEAGTLVIPRAGELLYRVGRPPAPAEASA